MHDREKKTAMKEEGRPAREVQDHFAFILVKDPSVMTKISQEGVKTKPIAFNALGKKYSLFGQIGKIDWNTCVDEVFFIFLLKKFADFSDIVFFHNSNSHDSV